MKTVTPKVDDIERKWFVIDAEDQVLGRIASQAAYLLRGKHRPQFTPHLDLGDHVIIVNAEKVKVTGGKESQKTYTRYTGYPGGLRKVTLDKLRQSNPERIVKHAVKGMLPKNKLGRKMITKLRIYAGPDHPHQAQKAEALPESLRRV